MEVNISSITGETLRLLDSAVKECCTEDRMGLVFSAGIDSTLIGVLASKYCKVEAYAVGIKGSHDLDYAKRIKEEVDFNINLIEVREDEIEKNLPRIVKSIKSTSPLDAAVAIPFYFASRKASEEGIKVMLCGQGADELFGGYNRYIELLGKGTYEQLDELMRKDLRELPESNLDRDKRVCKSNKVKLEIPFLDKKFVEYAQEIPVQLKVRELAEMEKPEYECVDEISGLRLIRKYILRKIAEEANVPDDVIQREKKAAQYGSGSQKTIEKLARKNDFKDKAEKSGRKDYQQMYLESML